MQGWRRGLRPLRDRRFRTCCCCCRGCLLGRLCFSSVCPWGGGGNRRHRIGREDGPRWYRERQCASESATLRSPVGMQGGGVGGVGMAGRESCNGRSGRQQRTTRHSQGVGRAGLLGYSALIRMCEALLVDARAGWDCTVGNRTAVDADEGD
ncbi:hypothetical protein DFJ73DRAFT_816125 [Zopfochytrium polystomum]|nr:hypothetical protein DFJ73DRAFT_816125 [Zopfochytrium polystomum]